MPQKNKNKNKNEVHSRVSWGERTSWRRELFLAKAAYQPEW
jgi:hypothetical protein